MFQSGEVVRGKMQNVVGYGNQMFYCKTIARKYYLHEYRIQLALSCE